MNEWMNEWVAYCCPMNGTGLLLLGLALWNLLGEPFEVSINRSSTVMPKVSEGGEGEFSSFHFLRTTKHSSPSLSSALYGIGGLLMCFVWQPPSNSLFVAVTDYTTLLFCFDSTRHSYWRFIRQWKVGGRGIYTVYSIVSKETTLGIAALAYDVDIFTFFLKSKLKF